MNLSGIPLKSGSNCAAQAGAGGTTGAGAAAVRVPAAAAMCTRYTIGRGLQAMETTSPWTHSTCATDKRTAAQWRRRRSPEGDATKTRRGGSPCGGRGPGTLESLLIALPLIVTEFMPKSSASSNGMPSPSQPSDSSRCLRQNDAAPRGKTAARRRKGGTTGRHTSR